MILGRGLPGGMVINVNKSLVIFGLTILLILAAGWAWQENIKAQALESTVEDLEALLDAQMAVNNAQVDSIQEIIHLQAEKYKIIIQDLKTLEAEKAAIIQNYEKEMQHLDSLDLDGPGWAKLLTRSANNFRNR
jgi:hypothetical protein